MTSDHEPTHEQRGVFPANLRGVFIVTVDGEDANLRVVPAWLVDEGAVPGLVDPVDVSE